MQKIVNIVGIVLSFAVIAAVVVLSLVPSVSVPAAVPFADKGAHFIAYAAIGFAVFLSFFRLDQKNWRSFFLSFAIGIAIGGVIELLQPQFGRAMEILDFAADAMGSFLGASAGEACGLGLQKMAKK
jgi:VanZ family protein